jgi:transcription elongation factor Elf1
MENKLPKHWDCRLCGRRFFHHPMGLRHVKLAHHSDGPKCRKCGVDAEARNPRSKAGTWNVCRDHAMRFASCRWCGRSYEYGWGYAPAAGPCDCGRRGVYEATVLEVAS